MTAVLGASVFAGIYLAVILTLVGNWSRPALYDDIPDLIIFAIAVVVFFRTRGLKGSYVKYILIGSFIVAIQRLLRIPLQELQHVGLNLPVLWFFLWAAYFIGIVLILMGFKKRYG